MRDLLPDLIRNRRREGHTNAVYYLGLARNFPALEALVRQAPSEALEMFDQDRSVQCLYAASPRG
jgi:hypothetical protein